MNSYWWYTWTGKIFTATYSLINWAFQTQPKRPRALISSSCSGFRPTKGDGGAGPGSWKTDKKKQLRLVPLLNLSKKMSALLSPLLQNITGTSLSATDVTGWHFKWESECGLSHLAQVYVAVGRFAVAVHPQGQNEGQGQHAERQQGVHKHIEQGGHSGWRPDFHCQGGTE